uniref:Muscular LMNA interacting protein n=1 Tax=Pelusios castaneus TaxID=367368 RepID=A0A8C8VLI9_9SAUR
MSGQSAGGRGSSESGKACRRNNRRSNIGSEDLTLKSGIRQDSESTYHTGTRQKIFLPKGYTMSKGEMQESDLFKAEFIFITDSDEGDEEAISRNNVQQPAVCPGNGHARCQLSRISTGGDSSKPLGDLNVPESQRAGLSHSPRAPHPCAPSILTSPSASDHLSHKLPAVCLISPTKLKVERDMVNPNQASSLEGSHKKWQSATRSSKHDSSACFQATAHSSYAEMPGSPNQPVSPCSSKRFNTFFGHITTHPLTPSPKPLSSPFHGSSSTICSVNEPCSIMSSSGNLVKSGITSPLPTRLSLLTAILKSGSSQQRPLSPASCPPTFSLNSLCSSTLTIDQKFKTSPPTPKKSASSLSVRSNSPGQEEHLPSVFSHSPIHVPLSSKPISAPWARSLSSKKHLYARTLSPDSLCPLSSNISSYRKTILSPLSPSKASSIPPPAPRHSSSLNPVLSPTKRQPYSVHKPHGPEKSRRVHTFSPTLEKCSSSSPNILQSAYKSKAGSSQLPGQELNPISPTPSKVSTCWSSTPANSPSLLPPLYNIHSHSLQCNSSSGHPKYRAYSSDARPKQLPATPCKSPVPVGSPCTVLSRSRELSSPKPFSLPSDHENLKPKQYKIKTSYKAFAAIPTNTLLMEQKVSVCSRMSTTLQRAAGRETRYVSPFIIIYILTKPGVIRPGSVKAKSILKTEEPYQPNPFKKYLEETSDPAIEQVSALFKHYRPKIL